MVIAKLVKIEAVWHFHVQNYKDLSLGIQNKGVKLQKLSFEIDTYPSHEMFSFHIPMKRELNFDIDEYYQINISPAPKIVSKELRKYE